MPSGLVNRIFYLILVVNVIPSLSVNSRIFYTQQTCSDSKNGPNGRGCANGGTCIDQGNGKFKCQCNGGYVGLNCEKQSCPRVQVYDSNNAQMVTGIYTQTTDLFNGKNIYTYRGCPAVCDKLFYNQDETAWWIGSTTDFRLLQTATGETAAYPEKIANTWEYVGNDDGVPVPDTLKIACDWEVYPVNLFIQYGTNIEGTYTADGNTFSNGYPTYVHQDGTWKIEYTLDGRYEFVDLINGAVTYLRCNVKDNYFEKDLVCESFANNVWTVDNTILVQTFPNGQCSFNPCHNGGTCQYQALGQYLCDCPAGFPGPLCETQTPSMTLSNTPSSSITSTSSSTSTNTLSSSTTISITGTFTTSETSTNTPFKIPTLSGTPTFTDSRTMTTTTTDTRSSTNTLTKIRTKTATVTISSTSTMTFTNTLSHTMTSTDTDTSTRSETDTHTPTRSRTSTFSGTTTFTSTPTKLFTLTSTATFTSTLTPSRTGTATPTNTAIRTHTSTPTHTSTFTPTRTQAATLSPTLSKIRTLSPSPTPTFSRRKTTSPTITITNSFTSTRTIKRVTSTGTTTYSNTATRIRTLTPTKKTDSASKFNHLLWILPLLALLALCFLALLIFFCCRRKKKLEPKPTPPPERIPPKTTSKNLDLEEIDTSSVDLDISTDVSIQFMRWNLILDQGQLKDFQMRSATKLP